MSYRQIVQHTLALCATAHITRLEQGKINERLNLNRKGYFTSRMMKRLCSYEWTFSCITLVNSGTKRSYHILITIVFLLIFDPFSRPLQQYNASDIRETLGMVNVTRCSNNWTTYFSWSCKNNTTALPKKYLNYKFILLVPVRNILKYSQLVP